VNYIQNVPKIFKFRITNLDISEARECRIIKQQLSKKLNYPGFYSNLHIIMKRNAGPGISHPTFYCVYCNSCSTLNTCRCGSLNHAPSDRNLTADGGKVWEGDECNTIRLIVKSGESKRSFTVFIQENSSPFMIP
jgi:hypothetical protein